MINEKKLIAKCEKLANDEWNKRVAPASWADAYRSFVEDIEDQPTIQPQENRGKWIRYEDTHENSVKYICPFCGDYTAFRDEISESTVNGNYIYCRHCGAKNGEDQ